MLKCDNCGAVNSDDSLFCAECGYRLNGSARPHESLTPEEVRAAAMERSEARPEFNNEQPAPAPAPAPPAPVTVENKPASARARLLGYENKHKLFCNLTMLLTAFIIIMVALFAPIKVVDYEQYKVAENDDERAPVVHFLEIDQSIVQVLSNVGVIVNGNYSVQECTEVEREHDAAVAAARRRFKEWLADHPEATISERSAKMEEYLSDELSETNYIKYLLIQDGSVTAGEDYVRVNFFNGLFGPGSPLYLAVLIAFAAANFGIAIAVMATVYMILAIIGLCKKKEMQNTFRFMRIVLKLSSSAATIMACSPMGKAAGLGLGVFMFTAIVYLIAAVTVRIVAREARVSVVIKRASISLVALICSALLLTNTIAFVNGNTQYNAPMGFGYTFFFESANYSGAGAIGYSSRLYYTALALYIISVTMTSTAVDLVVSDLNWLKTPATRDVARSDCFARMILVMTFAALCITVGLVGSSAAPTLAGGNVADNTQSLFMRAQVYVFAVLILASAIVTRVYMPERKPLPAQV